MHPSLAHLEHLPPLAAYRRAAVTEVQPATLGGRCLPTTVAPLAPVTTTVPIVEFPSGTVCYGLLDRAREAADRYNATRGPDVPEVWPVVARAVVVARGETRPGCTLVSAELPRQLWQALQERCEVKGVDPSRVLAAMVLNHLNKPPEKFTSMIPQVERWEGGKRQIPFADQWAKVEVQS